MAGHEKKQVKAENSQIYLPVMRCCVSLCDVVAVVLMLKWIMS